MKLTDKIERFLASPFPLWEKDLTVDLVASQWESFKQYEICPGNYTTSRGLYWDKALPDSSKIIIWVSKSSDVIQLESAEDVLHKFYSNTSLEIIKISEDNSLQITEKLSAALKMLDRVPGMLDCLSLLVKTVQVVRQNDPEFDTSHTDPEIPFSIFVSVCDDLSPISSLRVAESILHEAMHLKLTLIEKHVDLIVPETGESFYSPWRGEQRLVRGVLHGLFVFVAVREFYKYLIQLKPDLTIQKYLSNRILEITAEILSIQNFTN